MRIFCMMVLFLASTAWASRIPLDYPAVPVPPGENAERAEIIALVKVMSVSPARPGIGYDDVARAFVNDGIKGVKTGQVIDIYSLKTNLAGQDTGLVRSGVYLIHAKKEPTGAYFPSSTLKGWPDRSVVTKRVEEIRTYMAGVEQARHEAVRLYPDLGDSQSKLHAEFMRRYTGLRPLGSPLSGGFFNDPNWPVILAKEAAKAIK